MSHPIHIKSRPRKLTLYGPGETSRSHRPGDFILVHSDKSISKLIRFGERLRYKGAEAVYADYNHAAILIDRFHVIEALADGVTISPLSKYADIEYIVITADPIGTSPDSDAAFVLRSNAVDFAHNCVGEKYGLLTDLCIAVGLVTGGGLSFGFNGQVICSGLVACALERMGYNFNPRNPSEIMPADLACCFDIRNERAIEEARSHCPVNLGEPADGKGMAWFDEASGFAPSRVTP